MKKFAPWLCVAITLAAVGCAPSVRMTKEVPRGAQMPPLENPEEHLNEERVAFATQGLSFSSGLVKVTSSRKPDREKSVKLAEAAESSLNTENVWFKAAGLFRDAIIADPSYAPAYEGFARTILLEGGTTMAAAALKTAISLDPNLHKARFELGVVAQMDGDYKGAIQIWKELVAREPNYPDAYARMAIASYFDQDNKSARMYLEEADKRKQNVPPQFRDLLEEASSKP